MGLEFSMDSKFTIVKKVKLNNVPAPSKRPCISTSIIIKSSQIISKKIIKRNRTIIQLIMKNLSWELQLDEMY